jgi:Tol biopolymer transport system component
MIRWLWVLLVASLMGSTPASDDLTGRLVFSTEGDVYVMNADGSERTRLTTHPDEDFDPAWSPDGTRIAFRSHRDGDEEVYVMNADGSVQTNLTNNPTSDYSPAWSPDGTQIAFASDRAGRSGNDIWIMDADGANPVQITAIAGISEYPTWSPDGSRIAFACTFGRRLPEGVGDFEICVVNADGTELVQLTDEANQSKLPAWSPDSEQIAFQSSRLGWPTPPAYDEEGSGDYEIYVMNADGTEQVNLTEHPRENDEFPAWSRDGRLVFSRHGCLMVMNADGSEVSPVETCRDGGQFADWWQPVSP